MLALIYALHQPPETVKMMRLENLNQDMMGNKFLQLADSVFHDYMH